MKICSIDGCERLVHARGWCGTHYKRWEKHGDPTMSLFKSKAPNGAVAAFMECLPAYDIGCITWPFSKNNRGYGTFTHYGDNAGRSRLAHRHICELHNGPPPTKLHDAAHSCGKGHEACVAPAHLSWKTRAENMADTKIHGTFNHGEKAPWSKLSASDVLEIRELIKTGMFQREIAKRYGVSLAAVNRINTGKNWKYL